MLFGFGGPEKSFIWSVWCLFSPSRKLQRGVWVSVSRAVPSSSYPGSGGMVNRGVLFLFLMILCFLRILCSIDISGYCVQSWAGLAQVPSLHGAWGS